MTVIDVSQFNGIINWSKVAKACDGAIIRAGYRGYAVGSLVTDTQFKKNMAGAKAAGVPIGVYFVTQAINVKEAKEEARYTMALCKGYKLDLPIFIDSEDSPTKVGAGRADHGKLSTTQRTEILSAFCEEVEKEGYKAGVYASEFWLKAYCVLGKLKKFYIWVAKYSKQAPSITYNAWQYTSQGRINGVSGNVDLSKFTKIKTTKPKTTTKKKTNEDIAKEVILGKWGNGDERKAKLTGAGYNYKTIQGIVNKLLKKEGKA